MTLCLQRRTDLIPPVDCHVFNNIYSDFCAICSLTSVGPRQYHLLMLAVSVEITSFNSPHTVSEGYCQLHILCLTMTSSLTIRCHQFHPPFLGGVTDNFTSLTLPDFLQLHSLGTNYAIGIIPHPMLESKCRLHLWYCFSSDSDKPLSIMPSVSSCF